MNSDISESDISSLRDEFDTKKKNFEMISEDDMSPISDRKKVEK